MQREEGCVFTSLGHTYMCNFAETQHCTDKTLKGTKTTKAWDSQENAISALQNSIALY